MNPRTLFYLRRFLTAAGICFVATALLSYLRSGDMQFIGAVLFVVMFTSIAAALILLNPDVLGLQPAEAALPVQEQALVDEYALALHYEDTKIFRQ